MKTSTWMVAPVPFSILCKKRDCADWNSLVKNDEMCLCLRFSSDSLISSDGNHLVDVVN